MNAREFQERLMRRARRASVTLSAELGSKLEVYYRLLATWNQKMNLTGLNLAEPTPEALDRLLIEPLVAVRHAATGARQIIDIGSGGGSPAIPFALAIPGAQLLMVESKTRKSVFLREALRALEMNGSSVATSRFEELLSRPDLHETHDLLTIRAVRTEARVLMGLQALVRPGGQILLFKSSSGSDPADNVTPPLAWRATYPLIEALRSRLVVLDKRLDDVPRGTIA
jgi:16S rRNA (guanine527-N7)-methyltransferase